MFRCEVLEALTLDFAFERPPARRRRVTADVSPDKSAGGGSDDVADLPQNKMRLDVTIRLHDATHLSNIVTHITHTQSKLNES